MVVNPFDVQAFQVNGDIKEYYFQNEHLRGNGDDRATLAFMEMDGGVYVLCAMDNGQSNSEGHAKIDISGSGADASKVYFAGNTDEASHFPSLSFTWRRDGLAGFVMGPYTAGETLCFSFYDLGHVRNGGRYVKADGAVTVLASDEDQLSSTQICLTAPLPTLV